MLLNRQENVSAKRVIITSLLVDISDIIINIIISYLSGSIIIFTQVLDGVSDLTASLLLFVGLKRSGHKPNRMHPFGYGREMYFWSLLAALVMFAVTATFSFYLGYQRFIHPHPIHDIWLAVGVLFLTLFTNGYAFVLSYKRLLHGRSIRRITQIFYNSSLVETKTTFILDLMGTLSSLLGIISFSIYLSTGDGRWDGLGAMLIGVMLAALAFFLLLGIWDLLVGRSASPYVHTKIKRATESIKEVQAVLDIKTLHMGPERILVHLDVHMQDELTTDQLEKLIDKIKAQIRKEVPEVKNIQVELETPE